MFRTFGNISISPRKGIQILTPTIVSFPSNSYTKPYPYLRSFNALFNQLSRSYSYKNNVHLSSMYFSNTYLNPNSYSDYKFTFQTSPTKRTFASKGKTKRSPVRKLFQPTRGDPGHGWFELYDQMGPEGFLRYQPPTPFQWNKMTTTNSKENDEIENGKNSIEKKIQIEVNPSIRSKVYFNVCVGRKELGKIVIELADDLLPKTCQNFRNLCEILGEFS